MQSLFREAFEKKSQNTWIGFHEPPGSQLVLHGFFTIMHCFVIQSVLYGLCASLVATCNDALNFHAAVFEHAKRLTNIPYRRICKYQHLTLDGLSAFATLVLQLMTICVNSLHFVACIRTRAPLVRRDCTEWWKTTLTSILWQKTDWPCGFGGWKGCKRRHFNNHAVWIFIIFLIRIGEAQNPGPDLTNEELKIFHCNPTALIGKEHEVASWGEGITLISETSATSRAQKIIQSNLRKQNLKTIWSKPVLPYKRSSGETRGLAGGTAIICSYPIRRTLEPLPEDIETSDRYTEAIVQVAPGYSMFCVAIYGAVIGQRYHDSLGITDRLFSVAAQRAVKFQGPAIIVGDFNCDLNQLSLWPSLAKHGWNDTALRSSELNEHALEMTYNNITRHSFILTSGDLKNALVDCRTIKHHVFSQHPVIRLRLKMKNIIEHKFV